MICRPHSRQLVELVATILKYCRRPFPVLAGKHIAKLALQKDIVPWTVIRAFTHDAPQLEGHDGSY